jgi:hypothetical protein
LWVDDSQLKKLNQFISGSIKRDEVGNPFKLSDQAGGKIRFFKSPLSYHLFRTCNTWIAEGLHFAGFKIETSVILAEQLFNEAAKIGVVIKALND